MTAAPDKDRPILVTGGAGFVGGHVRLALAAAGYRVRCLDLAEPRPKLDGEEVRIGSVTDADTAENAVGGSGGVIHAAAIAHLWCRDPQTYDRVNLEGTETMLKAAGAAGAPMVHVSSFTTLVARTARDGDVLDESVVVPPGDLLGPYPRSKRRAELAVEKAAAHGQRALSVLPSAPVGPGDRNLTPPGRLIRHLAAGRTPALVDCLLNLVDVQALAGGIVAALERGRAGERYLLCGDDVALEEIAGKIAVLTGTPAPRARVPMPLALAASRIEAAFARLTGWAPNAPLTGVRLAARRVRFANGKAARELGFRPPPIDRSLAAAVAWLRSEGHLDDARTGA